MRLLVAELPAWTWKAGAERIEAKFLVPRHIRNNLARHRLHTRTRALRILRPQSEIFEIVIGILSIPRCIYVHRGYRGTVNRSLIFLKIEFTHVNKFV
jgi:hypothetical protein